jgi:hypothetical protein
MEPMTFEDECRTCRAHSGVWASQKFLEEKRIEDNTRNNDNHVAQWKAIDS